MAGSNGLFGESQRQQASQSFPPASNVFGANLTSSSATTQSLNTPFTFSTGSSSIFNFSAGANNLSNPFSNLQKHTPTHVQSQNTAQMQYSSSRAEIDNTPNHVPNAKQDLQDTNRDIQPVHDDPISSPKSFPGPGINFTGSFTQGESRDHADGTSQDSMPDNHIGGLPKTFGYQRPLTSSSGMSGLQYFTNAHSNLSANEKRVSSETRNVHAEPAQENDTPIPGDQESVQSLQVTTPQLVPGTPVVFGAQDQTLAKASSPVSVASQSHSVQASFAPTISDNGQHNVPSQQPQSILSFDFGRAASQKSSSPFQFGAETRGHTSTSQLGNNRSRTLEESLHLLEAPEQDPQTTIPAPSFLSSIQEHRQWAPALNDQQRVPNSDSPTSHALISDEPEQDPRHARFSPSSAGITGLQGSNEAPLYQNQRQVQKQVHQDSQMDYEVGIQSSDVIKVGGDEAMGQLATNGLPKTTHSTTTAGDKPEHDYEKTAETPFAKLQRPPPDTPKSFVGQSSNAFKSDSQRQPANPPTQNSFSNAKLLSSPDSPDAGALLRSVPSLFASTSKNTSKFQQPTTTAVFSLSETQKRKYETRKAITALNKGFINVVLTILEDDPSTSLAEMALAYHTQVAKIDLEFVSTERTAKTDASGELDHKRRANGIKPTGSLSQSRAGDLSPHRVKAQVSPSPQTSDTANLFSNIFKSPEMKTQQNISTMPSSSPLRPSSSMFTAEAQQKNPFAQLKPIDAYASHPANATSSLFQHTTSPSTSAQADGTSNDLEKNRGPIWMEIQANDSSRSKNDGPTPGPHTARTTFESTETRNEPDMNETVWQTPTLAPESDVATPADQGVLRLGSSHTARLATSPSPFESKLVSGSTPSAPAFGLFGGSKVIESSPSITPVEALSKGSVFETNAATPPPLHSSERSGRLKLPPSLQATPSLGSVAPFAPSAPTSGAGFLGQFASQAAQNEARDKAKRKAEEFDSDEDDEAEWERKDAEKQVEKKRRLIEAARGGSKPSFISAPTGGFLSQFVKDAANSEAEEKARRKAEDFDSEVEDEAEWERRDDLKQAEKKRKLSEEMRGKQATFTGSGFLPAAGSTTVPRGGPLLNNHSVETSAKSGFGSTDGRAGELNSVKASSFFGPTNGSDAGSQAGGDADGEHSDGDDSENSAVGVEGEYPTSLSAPGDYGPRNQNRSNIGKSLFERMTPIDQSAQQTDPDEGLESGSFGASTLDRASNSGKDKPFVFGQTAGDHTWKVDSPIKFGKLENTPSFAINMESSTTATNDESQTLGSRPFANLFTKSATASARQAELLGQGNVVLRQDLMASRYDSSRATTPGTGTDIDSANEIAGDENEAEKHEQADFDSIPADEEVIYEQDEVKALLNENKEWNAKGTGVLRLLKNRKSGAGSLLMRMRPSGKVVFNSRIQKQLSFKNAGKARVTLPLLTAERVIQSWVVQFGKGQEGRAQEFVDMSEKIRNG